MSLVPTGRARERILVFSIEGCGKSLTAMDIASRISTDQTVWIIDNDNAWERMLEGTTIAGESVKLTEEWYWKPNDKHRDGGTWEQEERWCVEGGRLVVFHCEGWQGNISALGIIRDRCDVEDWMVLDTASRFWANVQEFFTAQVFDSSMSDYFLKVRMQKEQANTLGKSLGALDGWTDWNVINPLYNDYVGKVLTNPPCHLICTAEQAEVTGEDKDKETLGLYASFGFKPTGQKRLGHQMQTVIQLRRDRFDDYFATSVKDRGGRVKLLNANITGRGFSSWYLEEIGGWVDQEEITQQSEPVARPKARSKG